MSRDLDPKLAMTPKEVGEYIERLMSPAYDVDPSTTEGRIVADLRERFGEKASLEAAIRQHEAAAKAARERLASTMGALSALTTLAVGAEDARRKASKAEGEG